MNSVIAELMDFIRDRRWDARVVPIEALSDLKRAIQEVGDQRLVDTVFYDEYLKWFVFNPPEALRGAKSLIVIAVPVPQMRVVFNINGKTTPALIPPTYVGYRKTNAEVQQTIAAFLDTRGYRTAGTQLPLKTLAARSGLARYGRNNICYVAGMGSFLQLVGCYSDLPVEEYAWGEPTMLAECESCDICLHSCPTGAITTERFLLRADHCLTYFNERRADFPSWIGPAGHNSLIGCMHCQRVCPANKRVRRWTEDCAEFSEDETNLLLSGAPIDEMPAAVVERLRSLNLSEGCEILPRNLRVLLNARTYHVGEGESAA